MHKEYYGGNIPWLKTGDLNDSVVTSTPEYITEEGLNNSSAKLNPKGSVLIAMYGATIGKVGILGMPATTNQACCACINYEGIIQKYLFYFLLSHKDEFIALGGGGAQPNISKDIIVKTLIPIPPINEQERIVSKIDELLILLKSLDANKDALEATLEQAKSKILDLAIHGKLVPQDANDEPASELLKRINPKAVASCDNPHYAEPYRLPHGWTWIELGKLAVDSADGPFGSNLKKDHYTTNNEVRIIQLSNIGENGWRDENTKYTTFEHLSEISRSEVKSGDIVIAKMMPAGRAILCPNSDLKYVLSSDAVKFVLPEGICNEYILNSINSSVFREQVYDNVQGVTRVRTSLQKLRTYVLPIPPYNEQLRIVEKVNELFSQLDMIEKSLQA